MRGLGTAPVRGGGLRGAERPQPGVSTPRISALPAAIPPRHRHSIPPRSVESTCIARTTLPHRTRVLYSPPQCPYEYPARCRGDRAGGSANVSVGYPSLVEKVKAFLLARGGAADEDTLIRHVFGSAGSPDLWRSLLRQL